MHKPILQILSDMPDQARDLVAKMKASRSVNMDRDWKMVTLFIGGNDLCDYCGKEVRQGEVLYPMHYELPSNLEHKSHQIPTLKCFSSRLAVASAQSIEARC